MVQLFHRGGILKLVQSNFLEKIKIENGNDGQEVKVKFWVFLQVFFHVKHVDIYLICICTVL